MAVQSVFIVRIRREKREKTTKERERQGRLMLSRSQCMRVCRFCSFLHRHCHKKSRQHHGLFAWSKYFLRIKNEKSELYIARRFLRMYEKDDYIDKKTNFSNTECRKKKYEQDGCVKHIHMWPILLFFPFSFIRKHQYVIICD